MKGWERKEGGMECLGSEGRVLLEGTMHLSDWKL